MNKNAQRVVVTGIGIVSPLGHDTSTTWQSLLAGKSGIAPIKKFDARALGTSIGGEVKNFSPIIPQGASKYLQSTHDFTHFAVNACQEALADAKIYPKLSTSDRWGLIAGSAGLVVSYNYLERLQKQFASDGEIDWPLFAKKGRDLCSAQDFHDFHFNNSLIGLAQIHQISGLVANVNTACASGGQAIGLACQAIKRGQVDYALAGGFDSMLNIIGLSKFGLIGAMTEENHSPEHASKPFDLKRNGFVLGEGAAFLVLESLDGAKKRKAKIYAELLGEGNTLSCYRITDSPRSGEGASLAIKQALDDADISIEQIDYINAHGTSTKMNDLSETNAIKAVFKERAYELFISSTKSQVGHLISAAGAIEAAFCVLGIDHQMMPGTANLITADPECDLNYCAETVVKGNINYVLSNSFGFGGTNNVLALRRMNDE